MANKANFTLAVANTPKQDGWCELYAELLLAGRSGLYPTAFAAYQAVPQKRGGTPPNDGNYYLLYFDGWFNLGDGLKRYGDIAVYRNGRVWSGSSVNFRRQDQSVSFSYYKSWIGTQYLCWSEYLGKIKIATIPTKKPKEKKVMVDLAGLQVLYRFYMGQDVSEYGMKHRLGKQTFAQAQAGILNSNEYKALVEKRKKEQTGFSTHLPVTMRNVIKLKEQE